ncbi:MAG: ribosome biogenesis GTPase YlqF [Candidatus Melainabacteria bacterium LEY3_CP_29_8]|nr:MAG: ribosome biogenesis GTPase YlqF [Candidatus Melainabacteria bacterium LEY3_CP_29_8]
MNNINWFPGHIAKAINELKTKLSLVDLVVELKDARIPLSSSYSELNKIIGSKPHLIILNKADLADNFMVKKFVEYYKNNFNTYALSTSSHNRADSKVIVDAILKLAKPQIEKLVSRGLNPRPARVMVIGMPNVGKSSFINKLVKKVKTKTGAKAGVTRQLSWVRINPKLDLLDTPGIIPVKLENQLSAIKLASVNGVSENAYSHEFVASELLKILYDKYPNELMNFYKLVSDNSTIDLQMIAKSRNLLIKNANPNIERAAFMVLNDFRNAKIGKFTLDELPNL